MLCTTSSMPGALQCFISTKAYQNLLSRGTVFSFQYVISQRNDRIKLPCLHTVVHAAYISSQGRNRKVGLRAELVILRSFVMAVALFAVIKPFYEP